MAERDVSEHDVWVTLHHPDERRATADQSNVYLRTMTSGRTLKVWTVSPEGTAEWVVKSVAWRE